MPFEFDGYWAFANAPAKWAIDAFLRTGEVLDTWGVDRRHADRFHPGQLAVVRVGVDQRNKEQLKGHPKLRPGIYALCEVLSEPFAGSGARDEFWYGDAGKSPGWPTVNIRYLRSYLDRPLLIDTVREIAPDMSRQLLYGWQGSSFPIPKGDFDRLLELLDETEDTFSAGVPLAPSTPDELADLEKRYADAAPQVKEAISRRIERGPIGRAAKTAVGFKCQICDAMGLPARTFRNAAGEWYVEAHHVMSVASLKPGTLSARNVIVLCANHHRQLHYGGIETIDDGDHFEFTLPERPVQVKKLSVA